MVDVFEHSARLDTAAIEERRDLVQVVSDGGKLPCDGFNFVRVDIEHINCFVYFGKQSSPLLVTTSTSHIFDFWVISPNTNSG